jgi:hypothetical protein
VTAVTLPPRARHQINYQSGTERRSKKETQLMFWNKITGYIVDSIALASAMIIATPFALVISAPFLGAM